ncbi:MAG: hypothetical protein RL885_04190 [Planctomycetota bacterium]
MSASFRRTVFVCLSVLALLLSPISAASGQDELEGSSRRTVPSEDDLQAVRAKIYGAYGISDLSDPSAKLEVAERLEADAEATPSNKPIERYGLFRAAMDLAADAGAASRSRALARKLAGEFALDGLDLEAETVISAGSACDDPNARSEAIAELVDLGCTAFREARYETAERLFDSSQSVAKKLDRSARRIVDEKHELFEAASAARKAVGSGPRASRDPGLDVGVFLCAVAGDWEEGLALLAKCQSKSIQEAAAADVAGPTSAQSQKELGDQWRDLSVSVARATPIVAAAWMQRARFWYEEALPELSPLQAAQVEKILSEKSSVEADSGSRAEGVISAKKGAPEEDAHDDARSSELLEWYPVGTTFRCHRTRSNGPPATEKGTVRSNDGQRLVVEAPGLSGPDRLWVFELDEGGKLHLIEQAKKNARQRGGTISNCASNLQMGSKGITGSYSWDLGQPGGKPPLPVSGTLEWRVTKRGPR